MSERWRAAGAVWAITGVALLFGHAAYRLGARGVSTIRNGLDAAEWVALALLTAMFIYGEGVRALQRRYVPHVMRRVSLLRDRAKVSHHLLAPLFALSLVGASTRSLLLAWAGVAAIAGAVVVVSRFPEPWRGIVDFAVAAALGWALVALLVSARRVLR